MLNLKELMILLKSWIEIGSTGIIIICPTFCTLIKGLNHLHHHHKKETCRDSKTKYFCSLCVRLWNTNPVYSRVLFLFPKIRKWYLPQSMFSRPSATSDRNMISRYILRKRALPWVFCLRFSFKSNFIGFTTSFIIILDTIACITLKKRTNEKVK